MKNVKLLSAFALAWMFCSCGEGEVKESGTKRGEAVSTAITTAVSEEIGEVKKVVRRGPSERLTINIKNGHLGKVMLGFDEEATDGYDRNGLDQMAPPPGMQTGYTALVSPDNKLYLYTDSRKPTEKVEFVFYIKVFEGKPVMLDWNPGQFPKDYVFDLQYGEVNLDMQKVNSLIVREETGLLITATKKK
ncbi:MAG: hypothetical protein ACRC37_07860 [Lentisphaeria bacterium]